MRYTTVLVAALTLPLFSAQLVIDSHNDIHRAGGVNSGSDGTAPPVFNFSAGSGQVLTFQSVTGTWECNNSGFLGPDGGQCFSSSMSVNGVGGLSGARYTDRNTVLWGVFLTDSAPGVAPADLRFYRSDSSQGGIQDNFAQLSPLIGQVFFIGDGLTGTGSGATQQFLAPDTATRLFLGYADAPGYSGNPGAFGDNAGSLTADFTIASTVPEPSTFALLAAGIALVGARRRWSR